MPSKKISKQATKKKSFVDTVSKDSMSAELRQLLEKGFQGDRSEVEGEGTLLYRTSLIRYPEQTHGMQLEYRIDPKGRTTILPHFGPDARNCEQVMAAFINMIASASEKLMEAAAAQDQVIERRAAGKELAEQERATKAKTKPQPAPAKTKARTLLRKRA